jgi:uncharacterized protein YndB with AHSA1/START domain
MSEKTPSSSSPTADREITASRLYDAPRELVWKLWTDPQHLTEWWGPRGFVTTTFNMDVRPGGVWRFVMHGPDGVDYQNKISYVEVDAPKRLVYKHGGDKETEPVNFEVTVTFDDENGKTRLSMRMLFPSAAAKNFTVEKYGAVEGLNQTLSRLTDELAKVETGDHAFILSRVVDAPRDLVWRAWTERERLMEWFGPKGFTMSHADMDFRPGGVFHYCLKSGEGHEMWGKWTFREIVPQQRIVLVNSFSDKDGNVARHPMAPTWPRETISTTTFAERERKTTVTVHWSPLNPTPDERQTFNAGRQGMTAGWSGTFEQLDVYVAKHKA